MRRWRTVGLIGVPTDDGRMIIRPFHLRRSSVVLLAHGKTEAYRRGFEGCRVVGEVEVRIVGDYEIQALLPWCYRKSTVGLSRGSMFTDSGILMQSDCTLTSIGPGPSAWGELR